MIHSLQVGSIKDYTDENGKKFRSALIKNRYISSLSVTTSGVEGNMISDMLHHGGAEKAVFANALSNYPLWGNFLGTRLKFGDMGENLTLKGFDERNVYIGDIHRIGSVVLQVSQPRKPCAKLYKIHKNSKFTKLIFTSGLTGWYYRVLKPGEMKLGDPMTVESTESAKLSIMELNRLFFNPSENSDAFDKLLMQKTISPKWVETIQKRLTNSYNNSYMSEI